MAKTFKRIKEKIADAKEKINVPKPVKRALVGAAFVGTGAIIGAVAKQYSEHQENEKINNEWKKQFHDADSVVADAKTAHFYASKKLSDDDVWQKRLYLRDLERAKIELQKVQLAEQAQELEDKFNLELQKDLGNAIQEGNLQKIDKALERGAIVGQSDIHSVSDPEAIFGPKNNALEVMQHIFDKYDDNNKIEEHRFPESKFWGFVVKDLEQRSATDDAWSVFYNKAKQKMSAAEAKEELLAKEFREKELKGEILMTVSYRGETFNIGGKNEQKKEEYPVNLRYICGKHYEKLYPQGVYGYGYLSTDKKLALLNIEIQETKNVIKYGHEYEIEAKAGENLRVESDVLQSYQGKHMRKEKADSLRNVAEQQAEHEYRKQQQEVDSLNAEEAKKGSMVRWAVMRSGAHLEGYDKPNMEDSGNTIKKQLKNKNSNIKDQFIDNERY